MQRTNNQDEENGLEPATENNIEGPYYRPGVPFRNRLYNPGDKGEVLVISGTVVDRRGRPIPGAVLDLWHTSAAGQYDNHDPYQPPTPDEFHFRGRIQTDQEGKCHFETIRPGHYRVTPTAYRTAHIHFKVRAAGYRPLIAQFFFKGEKYNKTDPWFKPSMVLELEPDGDCFRGTFHLVLAEA